MYTSPRPKLELLPLCTIGGFEHCNYHIRKTLRQAKELIKRNKGSPSPDQDPLKNAENTLNQTQVAEKTGDNNVEVQSTSENSAN
jgi:hypothetical protein